MTTESTRADPLLQETLLGEGFDNFDAAVFVADAQGRYVAVNRRACTLTGYTREELLGMSVSAIAVDTADYDPVVLGSKRGGTAALRRKDGGVVEVDWRAGATTIAGMPFYVGLNWPLEPSSTA